MSRRALARTRSPPTDSGRLDGGPVHAGVIEPGHFRFMCHGERVQHLEIQLGYQHRGVESLLLAREEPTFATAALTAQSGSLSCLQSRKRQ